MPKHAHNADGAQGHYASHLQASLGSSSMYGQQRMAVPATYYAVPSSSSASSSMPLPSQQPPPPPPPLSQQQQQQQQHQQQQQEQQEPQTDYESFDSAAEPVALPPAQHRASSGAWSPQNDHQLVAARMQGLNWGQIKDAYFPTKTANACRKRHERLMERKGADDWDNRKLQRLAREYMSMRKEIWSGLAARTGEKWNVVEQKCMSNGLKNLQSAARAASRRDRLETGSHVTGYDDDSGISGIGLTPVDELDASYSSPEMSSAGPPSFASSGSAAYVLPPQAHAGHLQQQQQQQQHHQHQHHQHQHQHQHQQHHQQQPPPPPAAAPYVSGYGSGGSGHGYSSSVSSTASAAAAAAAAGHRRYHAVGAARTGRGHGADGPYVDAQRMASADMGIGAIINRPGGGGRAA